MPSANNKLSLSLLYSHTYFSGLIAYASIAKTVFHSSVDSGYPCLVSD